MANLTYRQAAQVAPSSTTTKNAPLTSAEIDGNLKSLNDELVLKAPLASPTLTGTPVAPTATAGTNTTQIATTAFVISERDSTAEVKNKTINLTNNQLIGTLTEFNEACSDADFVSLVGVETLTNKTLIEPKISTIINESGILTLPTTTTTIVGRDTTDTLSNKTLTSPKISTISNGSATLTLPIVTTTIVGRDTTDTLSNKSISLGSNTITGTLVQFNNSCSDADFVSTNGVETLSNKTYVGAKEVKINIAANNIDLALGNWFAKTISTATAFTVSNIPATNTVGSFILELINGGSQAITWWDGVKWPAYTPPTLTPNGRDVLAFYTHDNGVTWTGLVLGKNIG